MNRVSKVVHLLATTPQQVFAPHPVTAIPQWLRKVRITLDPLWVGSPKVYVKDEQERIWIMEWKEWNKHT